MGMKKKITIEVKMFSKSMNYLSADFTDGKAVIPMEEGSTLEDLKKFLGIRADEFGGIVINNAHCEIEDSQVLTDGETLTFFAAVGGG